MSKTDTTEPNSDGAPGFMCAEGFRLCDADDYLRMLCMRIEAFTNGKNTNDWANVWQAYISTANSSFVAASWRGRRTMSESKTTTRDAYLDNALERCKETWKRSYQADDPSNVPNWEDLPDAERAECFAMYLLTAHSSVKVVP